MSPSPRTLILSCPHPHPCNDGVVQVLMWNFEGGWDIGEQQNDGKLRNGKNTRIIDMQVRGRGDGGVCMQHTHRRLIRLYVPRPRSNSDSLVLAVHVRRRRSRQPALRSGLTPAVPSAAPLTALPQSHLLAPDTYQPRASALHTECVRGCTCECVSVCICV